MALPSSLIQHLTRQDKRKMATIVLTMTIGLPVYDSPLNINCGEYLRFFFGIMLYRIIQQVSKHRSQRFSN
jgi:cobalamin biosynthesis protein CobT